MSCTDCQRKSTFTFWLLVQKYQQIIFMFIRAHWEGKFELMVNTLEMLVPLFFTLDHQNCARWIPVFIRDMWHLPAKHQGWIWEWTLDNNTKQSLFLFHTNWSGTWAKQQKGERGWWDNWYNRERWIVTVPEISCVVEEFDPTNDNDNWDERPHHEEGCASQRQFQRHVNDLMEVLLNNALVILLRSPQKTCLH